MSHLLRGPLVVAASGFRGVLPCGSPSFRASRLAVTVSGFCSSGFPSFSVRGSLAVSCGGSSGSCLGFLQALSFNARRHLTDLVLVRNGVAER
jgi:hypothetical protein